MRAAAEPVQTDSFRHDWRTSGAPFRAALVGIAVIAAAIRLYHLLNQPMRLDEAQTFGTAFSMAVQSGLALSFLADGPLVPQDLHPATAESTLSKPKVSSPAFRASPSADSNLRWSSVAT